MRHKHQWFLPWPPPWPLPQSVRHRSHDGELTVALDINLSDELISEGNARELINRIQNIRKEKDLNVTDKIEIRLQEHPDILKSLQLFKDLISNEVLAFSIETSNDQFAEQFEWLEDEKIGFRIQVKGS